MTETDGVCANVETLPPLHSGEVLREEFLKPLGMTPYAVAKAIAVPRNRIESIVRERLGISGDTALRLGRLFSVDPRFWMNLQASYDLQSAAHVVQGLDRIEPVGQAA